MWARGSLSTCATWLVLSACGNRPSIASCADDLGGTWRAASGTWMLVDDRETLEGYPIFNDVPQTASPVVVAPRLIDLRRIPNAIVGEVHRRFMSGPTACDARVPIHVLSCATDRLELVLTDPAPPITFAPCAWAGTAPSRREIWTRD